MVVLQNLAATRLPNVQLSKILLVNTAPVEFYLEAGDKINFDMKVTQDGHSWISYISYSGVRRYVQVD